MSMTKIATVTVGVLGAASIDFTSIPGTFTDLMVVVSGRATVDDVSMFMKFNGSSTGYTTRRLLGFGSGNAISQSFSEPLAGSANNNAYTASTFGNTNLYIPNYAGSSNKSWSVDSVTETNAAGVYLQIAASLWSNTAAITQVTLSINGGNFVQYSTATLYGVTKGSLAGVTVS